MHVIKKRVTKKAAAFMLVLDCGDDMWSLYNLIDIGDHISTKTIRKIHFGSADSNNDSERRVIYLCIHIQKIDYDPLESMLRLSGPTALEHPLVPLGSFHTIQVNLHKEITLYKNTWDELMVQNMENILNSGTEANISAVIMQEGLANLYLVSKHLTLHKARIVQHVARKSAAMSSVRKQHLQDFFSSLFNAIVKHVDFDQIKVFIIASPGFLKQSLLDYIIASAQKTENMSILKNKYKIFLANCSSVNKNSFNEILSNPNLMQSVEDLTVAREYLVFQKFLKLLKSDPDFCVYGLNHVKSAANSFAIKDLILSDNLLRGTTPNLRKQLITIISQVNNSRGSVHVLSSSHVSGTQLQGLCGICAILYYALPDLDLSTFDPVEANDHVADQEPKRSFDNFVLTQPLLLANSD